MKNFEEITFIVADTVARCISSQEGQDSYELAYDLYLPLVDIFETPAQKAELAKVLKRQLGRVYYPETGNRLDIDELDAFVELFCK